MDTHLARQLPNDIIIRVIREATVMANMDYWIGIAGQKQQRPKDDDTDRPPVTITEEITWETAHVGTEYEYWEIILKETPDVVWVDVPGGRDLKFE